MPNLAKREWGPLFDAVYEMNTASSLLKNLSSWVMRTTLHV